MKKLYFFICILAGLLSFSCINPNSPSSPSTPSSPTTQQEEISAGWYLYTTNANSTYKQATYFYINANGSIERAGSTSNEYTGTQLELLQGQLSYSICKNNADGTTIKFEKTTAPSWAGENNEDHDNSEETPTENTYLLQLYQFLTTFGTGYSQNRDNDTISFSNLSNTIQYDENEKPYITCSISFTTETEKAQIMFGSTSGTINNVRLYFFYKGRYNIITDGTSITSDFNLKTNCIGLSIDYSDYTHILLIHYFNNGSCIEYNKQ